MARRWRDPRDGTVWLIEAMPFDLGPAAAPDLTRVTGWTLVFASAFGRGDLPVGYHLGADLERLQDRELMMLLDAARRVEDS